VHLGLSKQELLRMSPREFKALTRCYQEREERMDRRFATLQAFYVNCNSDKRLTADDFMGKKTTRKYPTNRELEQGLTAMFGCGPGKEKQNG
jgi:hypothetical protein